MNIFAPLKSKVGVKALIDAGADEFYCGIIYDEWDRIFGKDIELNRRCFCGTDANFPDLNELASAIEIAHSFNKKVYLALNHHQYTSKQFNIVKKLIDAVKAINIDGVIAADIAVLEYIAEADLKSVASTDMTVYNSETIKFLKTLQVKRIIFSRDMQLDEIKIIREKFPELEFEAFMINGPCRFSDNICLPIHNTQWGAFCRFLEQCKYVYFRYDNTDITASEEHKLQKNMFYYHKFFFNKACGICALWYFIQYNIDSVKIVGRVLPLERVINDITFVKKNIDIAKTCSSSEEFLSKVVKPYSENEKTSCKWGYQCYFPELKGYELA